MKQQICLSFDVDWAHEKVIEDVLLLLNEYKIKATFYTTHLSGALNNVDPSAVEVGIHPNFNNLLAGSGDHYKAIIDELMNSYPDASGVRSHSLVQSGHILQHFEESGLRYDCNLFMPYREEIFPLIWTGNFVRLIYNWEDDVHYLKRRTFTLNDWDFTGLPLVIFDFHPIHVYLNTEVNDRYEAAKKYHKDPERLLEHRNRTKVPGTRDFLISLLQHIQNNRIETMQLKTLAEKYRNNENGNNR